MTQTIRDDGMQTFSLDPRRWPVGFLFSRSPLVRRSDRLEVLAIAFALAISLLALPIVATIATDVHRAHRGIYAEQSRTRHRAWIPTQGSTNVAPPSGHPAEEARRWVRNATPQGSPVEQWVDDAGNWVAPPTPLSRAAYDAVGMALALEGLVVTTQRHSSSPHAGSFAASDTPSGIASSAVFSDGGGRGHGSDRAR